LNDIQVKAALGTPTGTGPLFKAYAQGADESVWVVQTAGFQKRLALRRTQPKVTPTFQGVDRLSMKYTATIVTGTLTEIVVCEVLTSVPVSLSLANRQGIRTQIGLLMTDAPWGDAFETGILPT